VAVRVEIGAAHVHQQEVLPAVADGVVHVPAVGLEAERALESAPARRRCPRVRSRSRTKACSLSCSRASARQHPIAARPAPASGVIVSLR
jgi:hypothetical protein